MTWLTKNTGGQYIYAAVLNASTGAGETTGVAAAISLDGAASSAATNSPSHITGGLWVLELTQAETNADELAVVFTKAGASPSAVFVTTTEFARTNAGVAAAVWGALTASYNTASTFGLALGTTMTKGTIADAVWDEATADHASAGTFGLAVGTTATPAGIADAVWDEARSGHATSGTFGEYIDAAISSRAPSATALSTATWTSTRAGYLDNLDAAISTRAPSATALSTATWTSDRAALLDNLDATVSSRSSHAAADVWSVATRTLTSVGNVTVTSIAANAITASALAADAVAEIADGVWDEVRSGHTTSGSMGEVMDATISSRAAASTALSTSTWTADRAAALDNLDGAISDLPTADEITDAVLDEATSGHATSGTVGAAIGTITGGGLVTAVWAAGTRTLTNTPSVTVTSIAANAITASAIATDAGTEIASAVWDRSRASHVTSGTFGEALDATVSSRSSHAAADVWSVATRTITGAVTLTAGGIDAIWDEALSGHTTAGTAGKTLADL